MRPRFGALWGKKRGPVSDEYHVRLDAFEGPLDLLLFLIRRAEVEITDIPISQIADQYLDYLRHIDTIDVDRAGEFLVLAATLTEIKARMLAPTPAAGAEGADGEGKQGPGKDFQEVDPRADLVRQLLEYKLYRDAAGALERLRGEWERRFPAGGALKAEDPSAEPPPVDIDDVSLADLLEAFSKILATVDMTRVGEHHVAMDETPIELHAEDIVHRLREEASSGGERRGIPLQAMFAGRTRAEMIGLFLAMLELVKQRRVYVKQDRLRGEIVVTLAEEGADAGGGEQAAGVNDAAAP